MKSLVYNGRFSVGGFIRENFSRSKRNLLFKKKESTGYTESKSVSSLLPGSCHRGPLDLFERRAYIFAGIYIFV